MTGRRSGAAGISKKVWIVFLFGFLIVSAVISAVVTAGFGSTDVGLKEVWRVLCDHLLLDDRALNAGEIPSTHFRIVWQIRIPRTLFAMLVGAGLSIAGASMQALVRNPIADPYILGVSSGASAGAAAALLLPIPFLAGAHQTAAFAFAGALGSAALVFTLAKRAGGGQLQPVTMLLSGTAVNAVMSAFTSFLVFRARSPESIAAVYNWQMGSIAAAQWKTLALPAASVLAGTLVFTLMGGRFNMLMMGDEDAAALGLRVRPFRTGMFVVCSVVVASLVSVTGVIGFVGLVVPHTVRLLARTSDNRIVMPMSAVLGSIFVLWSDAAARSSFGAAEMPIGIVTALVGAPFFVFLLLKNGYGGSRA